MDKELLRYDRMVADALLSVVRETLSRVSQFGLPSGHALYLTFKTGAPGVQIPDRLKAEYPDAMTIVLEHQFWDLGLEKESFRVTLSFKGRRERLVVPFGGMVAFHDPGAQFGLRFDEAPGQAPAPEKDAPKPAPPAAAAPAEAKPKPAGAEVVSLDQFRKK